jgi:hypothetical protein
MRPFKVIGKPIQVGTGEKLVLNPAQIAARKGHLRVIEDLGADALLVEASQVLTFKAGEVIGLEEPLKNALDYLVDLKSGYPARKVVEGVQRASNAQHGKKAKRAKFVADATDAYQASAELQKQHKTVEDYIAALDAAEKAKK